MIIRIEFCCHIKKEEIIIELLKNPDVKFLNASCARRLSDLLLMENGNSVVFWYLDVTILDAFYGGVKICLVVLKMYPGVFRVDILPIVSNISPENCSQKQYKELQTSLLGYVDDYNPTVAKEKNELAELREEFKMMVETSQKPSEDNPTLAKEIVTLKNELAELREEFNMMREVVMETSRKTSEEILPLAMKLTDAFVFSLDNWSVDSLLMRLNLPQANPPQQETRYGLRENRVTLKNYFFP